MPCPLPLEPARFLYRPRSAIRNSYPSPSSQRLATNNRFQTACCRQQDSAENFGTTSVQLSGRKSGGLAPKRHQMKHLDF
jgi:hypothetical protein